MFGLSKIILELSSTGMFSNVESLDYNSISKDHIGNIQATFNNQKIIVEVFSFEDYEAVAKKIIKKAQF